MIPPILITEPKGPIQNRSRRIHQNVIREPTNPNNDNPRKVIISQNPVLIVYKELLKENKFITVQNTDLPDIPYKYHIYAEDNDGQKYYFKVFANKPNKASFGFCSVNQAKYLSVQKEHYYIAIVAKNSQSVLFYKKSTELLS